MEMSKYDIIDKELERLIAQSKQNTIDFYKDFEERQKKKLEKKNKKKLEKQNLQNAPN